MERRTLRETDLRSLGKNTNKKIVIKKHGDICILAFTILLAAFGILAVYSASSYVAKTQYGDEWFFVKKQAIGFLCGVIAMFFCAKLNPKRLQDKKVRYIAFIGPIVLLALVFVPGIGKSN